MLDVGTVDELIQSGRGNNQEPFESARVVHLIEALGSGGAERLLYTNLKHLDRNRFKSEVITIFSYASHWKEPIEELDIEVSSLDCQSLRDIPKGINRLRKRLKMNRPDLIHTHLWAANVIGRVTGRLSRVLVISSIHNPDHEPDAWNDGASVNLAKRQIVRLIDRWSAGIGCDRMIAVSEYVRQSAHRHLGFPLERIDLIYNPIDVDQFHPAVSINRREVMKELGLPDDGIILLNVARVSPQKGLLYAIQALPAVLRSFPSARLISVGATVDQAWLSRLRSEATSLGVSENVHFLGIRRDIPDLLRICDLFIFPSLYEGLGISLIEAMASGCACVATRTGPIPEVVRHGIDGWLVSPADAEDLSDAVCALLSDPEKRRTLGKAAADSSVMRFHPHLAARKLEDIYQSALNQKKPGMRRETRQQQAASLED